MSTKNSYEYNLWSANWNSTRGTVYSAALSAYVSHACIYGHVLEKLHTMEQNNQPCCVDSGGHRKIKGSQFPLFSLFSKTGEQEVWIVRKQIWHNFTQI